MRWCLCGRSRCLEDVWDYIWSADNKQSPMLEATKATEDCRLTTPRWFLPNASEDTWGFWGTWDRIHTGTGWAVRSVPAGTARSTTVLTGDDPTLYTRCSSCGWRCHRGCDQTPDFQSCGAQTECRLNCPESPGESKAKTSDSILDTILQHILICQKEKKIWSKSFKSSKLLKFGPEVKGLLVLIGPSKAQLTLWTAKTQSMGNNRK